METIRYSVTKRKLEQQHLQHIPRTSVIESYGIAARNIERSLLVVKDLLLGKHRVRQINKSEVAQCFVLRKLEKILRAHGIESERIEKIMSHIEANKEKPFMNTLEEAIGSTLSKEQTRQILGILHQHIIEAEFSKRGNIIYDPHENVIHTQDGIIDLGELNHENYTKVATTLKKYGINIKKTYFEMKNKQIILEALTKGRNPEEMQQIYIRMHKEMLKSDPLYREGYVEKIKEEIRKTAQVGGLFYGLHSFFTCLPFMIVSMLSRMLSQVLRMLPILGAVAAVSAEAAQVAVGLGEELRNRIEQSSHVFHSLPSQYLGQVGQQIEAQQAHTSKCSKSKN